MCLWGDSIKYQLLAQTGMAQWVEHHPTKRQVAGSIPSQGMCLGYSPDLWLEVCRRQPIDVFLPLFLPPFSSF